jgi:hypothetical protein
MKLGLVGKALTTRAKKPLIAGYRPESDVTGSLPERQATYYQGLVGVLCWICEVGQIDIIVEVSLMSQMLLAPRQGHLEQVLHIFAYYVLWSIIIDHG